MEASQIGLKEKEIRPVVDQLDTLLANYHIHYQKLRGCHWNVKGSHFFTLHIKFEELYTNALISIDELAERVLTLGKPPVSTFKEYLEISKIKEVQTIGMKDTDMVKTIMDDFWRNDRWFFNASGSQCRHGNEWKSSNKSDEYRHVAWGDGRKRSPERFSPSS